MKATLEFDLPEESDLHAMAVHALELVGVIRDVGEYLRGELKYVENPPVFKEALETVYAVLRDSIRERLPEGLVEW